MEIINVENYKQMSKTAYDMLLEQVTQNNHSVLGLATGSTPEGLYQELISAYQKGLISFKDTTSFNLDEYIGLDPENPNSYHFYMKDKLFKHIDLPADQAHLPSSDTLDLKKACSEYDERIWDAGHIDLQILGLGLNGHIGFNEPGTPFDSRTHIVDLDESTREANARFFDSIEDVPKQAITMGIKTIMESKRIVLLVSGGKKADAVNQLVNGTVTEEFPASILQEHPNVIVIGDEKALSKL